MSRMFTAAAAAAFANALTFAAMPSAHAATAKVEVADLDLSSADGQAKLESRIASAARSVCKSTVTGSRIAKVDAECVTKARSAIEKQLAARRSTSQNGG